MFLHFFLNELYGFFRNVTAIVLEALKLSQQWKKSVSDPTTQLIIICHFASIFVKIFKKSNLRHFSLEVGSIFEEVAFVELVEFIPYFLACFEHLFIFFL